MKKNSKYLSTVVSCYSPMPSYKRGWMEDKIPLMENYLQKNYSKIKTDFSLASSSLILVFGSLVTYNFKQVIISRNYFS